MFPAQASTASEEMRTVTNAIENLNNVFGKYTQDPSPHKDKTLQDRSEWFGVPTDRLGRKAEIYSYVISIMAISVPPAYCDPRHVTTATAESRD